MRDIAFIRPATLVISGTIKDKSTDEGLLLYQKIVVMILSSASGAYRLNAGTTFVEYIGRGNMGNTDFMKSLLLTACVQAKQCLDLLDSNEILKISVETSDNSADITIELKSGEIYTGTIK